jgi:hypothetical protein
MPNLLRKLILTNNQQDIKLKLSCQNNEVAVCKKNRQLVGYPLIKQMNRIQACEY